MESGEENRDLGAGRTRGSCRTQVWAELGEQGLCRLGLCQLTPAQHGWSVAVTLLGKSNTKTQVPPSISALKHEWIDFPVAQP